MSKAKPEVLDQDVPDVLPAADALWVPTALSVRAFRGATDVAFDLDNVAVTILVGPNGAGKTSVLEAVSWLLTGEVLADTGKRVQQSEYAPEDGGDTLVRLQLRDGTGQSQPAQVFVQRSLGPHRVTIGAVGAEGHECGSRDALDVLRMVTGLNVAALSHLMAADRFVRLRPQEQREYLLDLVGGAGRQVSLVTVASDELQRALTAEALEAVGEVTSGDDVQAAVELAGERRTVADHDAKAAAQRATEERGALAEALAEIAEAGYEGETLDELAAAIADAGVVTEAALAEAQESLVARGACAQDLKRLGDELGNEEQKLELFADERETVEAQRVSAAQAVENARQVVTAAQAAYTEALEGARAGQDAEVERLRGIAIDAGTHIESLAETAYEGGEAYEAAGLAVARAAERLENLRDLVDGGICPTCKRPTNEGDFTAGLSVLETEHEARVEAQELAGMDMQESTNALEAGRATHQAARDAWAEAKERDVDPAPERDAVAAAEVTVQEAQAALAEVPVLPDEAATRDQIDTLRGRIDELDEQIEAAEATLAIYPDDLAEMVETLREAVQAHAVMAESIKRARDREERATTAAQEQATAEAERLAWERLKRAWEDLLGESMTGELDPLLDDVSAVLRPVRDWEAAWTAEGPVVVGRGMTRAFDRLSDGERLMAGAAWQAALARRVGLGMALIDHAAEIDDGALLELLEALVSISRETAVQFLVARPGLPGDAEVVALPGGVQVVTLADGRLA